MVPDISLQINVSRQNWKIPFFPTEIFIKMCKRCTWLWNKTWNTASNFWYTHCQQQGNASEINMEDTFPYCTKAAWIGRFNNAYSLMHIRSTASSKVELNKFIIQKKNMTCSTSGFVSKRSADVSLSEDPEIRRLLVVLENWELSSAANIFRA